MINAGLKWNRNFSLLVDTWEQLSHLKTATLLKAVGSAHLPFFILVVNHMVNKFSLNEPTRNKPRFLSTSPFGIKCQIKPYKDLVCISKLTEIKIGNLRFKIHRTRGREKHKQVFINISTFDIVWNVKPFKSTNFSECNWILILSECFDITNFKKLLIVSHSKIKNTKTHVHLSDYLTTFS